MPVRYRSSGRIFEWIASMGPQSLVKTCARTISPPVAWLSTQRSNVRINSNRNFMKRKLKMGMVGGGRDAFIGGVHRIAAWMDGKIELVAGAFSSNAEKSRLSGSDLFLDPARVYPSFETMAAEEAKLPAGKRIDFVS